MKPRPAAPTTRSARAVKGRTVERGLDQRRARRVAAQRVGQAGGAGVERAGLGHPVVCLVEATAVEDEVQRSGLLHPQRRRVGPFGQQDAALRRLRRLAPPGLEPDAVAELEQERVVAVRVVDVLERGADHVPAARHQHGVDRRLLVGDRDREGGDVGTRNLATRDAQPLVGAGHHRLAHRRAGTDAVVAGGVELRDRLGVQARLLRDLVGVDAAVSDPDRDLRGILEVVVVGSQRVVDPACRPLVGERAVLPLHVDRPVAGVDLAHALGTRGIERRGQREHAQVGLLVEDRGVAQILTDGRHLRTPRS